MGVGEWSEGRGGYWGSGLGRGGYWGEWSEGKGERWILNSTLIIIIFENIDS